MHSTCLLGASTIKVSFGDIHCVTACKVNCMSSRKHPEWNILSTCHLIVLIQMCTSDHGEWCPLQTFTNHVLTFFPTPDNLPIVTWVTWGKRNKPYLFYFPASDWCFSHDDEWASDITSDRITWRKNVFHSSCCLNLPGRPDSSTVFLARSPLHSSLSVTIAWPSLGDQWKEGRKKESEKITTNINLLLVSNFKWRNLLSKILPAPFFFLSSDSLSLCPSTFWLPFYLRFTECTDLPHATLIQMICLQGETVYANRDTAHTSVFFFSPSSPEWWEERQNHNHWEMWLCYINCLLLLLLLLLRLSLSYKETASISRFLAHLSANSSPFIIDLSE